ncbi:MAG: phosphonopyruvate decarboxylase [Actinomycetota bacterium]|nr:phosphonopyruvate decarboxylase [Actinomycetota bacterium]MDQ2958252.1 phosphonopyruvate decarboxylase [Actinomycetota bacterium]
MNPPIGPAEFVSGLRSIGIGQLTSVPCSYFTGVLRHLDRGTEPRLPQLAAVNEGSALALAAGSWLGGVPAAVLAQNSGFGNLINPLTSLLMPYRIPALVFISMRGWPVADPGEPQHLEMGRVVPDWLDSLDIPYRFLTADGQPLAEILAELAPVLADRRPAFVLVAKGVLDAGPAEAVVQAVGPNRADLIEALLAERTDEFAISTTGYLSRALFNAGDRPDNFYMQGSMGHAGAIALGAALARPERRVLVLDGDGALLMHLGSGATVGHVRPDNLLHLVFDNAGYESTGAQPTAAVRVDFAAVASGLGYRRVLEAGRVEQLRPAIAELLAGPGPALLVVHGATSAGTPDGRASEAISTAEIASRFAGALANGSLANESSLANGVAPHAG